MALQTNKDLLFKYQYDFAVSGGAVGNINLVCKSINPLESGMIIKEFTIYVTTALAGSATPTVTMGNAGDRDGYAVDFYSDATTNAVINVGDRAGALMFDDTNDHVIHYRIDSSGNVAPSITIGSQALTAGKFDVYFRAFKPA